MFYPAEGGSHLTHGLYGHTPPNRSNRRQQVLHIVQAAQFHVLARHHRRYGSLLSIAEHVILCPQEGAIVGFMQTGKPYLLAFAVALHPTADFVLIAQHSAARRFLPQQDVPLGVDVLLHILVMIQMVGRHIGNHRHLGAAAHADQLEAGQFHHRHRIRRYIRQLGQQRSTDIPPQENLPTSSFHHFGNQCGGGSFPVGTGHGNDLTGAELKEQFHLAGDHGAGLQRCLKFRFVVLVARRTHNDILPGKTIGIMFAQAQRHMKTAKRIGVVTKLLQALFLVTECNLSSQLYKLFNAALMADTRADKGNFFAADQFLQLFDGQHCASLPCC